MTGWFIALGLFTALVAIRVTADYIYTIRKNKYTIEKKVTEANTVEELIDLRKEANGDKKLIERIDRKLDSIPK